jgi:YD repeat-containing protein
MKHNSLFAKQPMRSISSYLASKWLRRAAVAVSCIGLAMPAYAADTVAPSVPGNLVVTPASSTQNNVSWDAATDNVAVTAYLVERCTGVGCTTFAQIASVTGLTYNNTALAPATSYSYRIRARDAANNRSAYSTIVTVTTPPDTQAPTAPTNVVITVVSDTKLTVSWTAATDDVKVTGYLVERCLGAGCSTFAQVSTPTTVTYNNTGLVPNSSYSYRVRAKDAANNLSAYSSVASASTLQDTQAPTIPGGITATVNSNTKITVTWTAATDDVKVTGYRVERCQGVGCTSFVQVATPTGLSFANTGLVAGSSYSYRVLATDAAGNLSGYSTVATALTTGADVTAPTAPTGLAAIQTSSTQINLSWTASTDNVAVTNYLIERCQGTGCSAFVQVATSATPTYSDTTLTASTSYSYRVRATDAANNVSAYSNTASATTTAPVDTEAPTPQSGLTATATSTTQINLNWTASFDAFGVSQYFIERCQGVGCSGFARIASLTGTTYSDSGLAVSVSYSYRVQATDAANNFSNYSTPASETTFTPPPVTYSYGYDALGRLTQATGSDGSQITYQYDANGNVTSITRQ